ncbi:hypothetical protein [Photobacterium atrarenae]|uniref:DUF3019 domain-containing protein n=1 Tax=Photobacterium atrarenae TaxID=865757 RepID=A0ABY5GN02_9GAMM|nr:hypothetical protein [Photobacterium atrarenae]UTV29683.1 hypothetical protein NNL38_21985 [Photobacterium atrarenae]
MIKVLLILALFSSPNVYAEHPPTGEIKDCTLSVNGSQQETTLLTPCSWAVNSDGSLQIRRLNNKSIAILVGKPISVEQQTEWGVTKNDLCSFESIGVELDDFQRPVAISQPLRDALVCSNILVDDIFFMSYRWE